MKLLVVAGLLLAIAPPAGALEFQLGTESPSLRLRASSQSGQYSVQVNVAPSVRSVSFRCIGNRNLPDSRNVPVEITLKYAQPLPGQPEVVFTGRVVPNPKPELQGIYRVYLSNVNLKPRTVYGLWTLHIRTVPPPGAVGEQEPQPLDVLIQVDADARPITPREQALMEWRKRINPEVDPEAVRSKVMDLTDEEVRFYTGFKDRQNFLDLWGRKTLEDFEGKQISTDEYRGLLVTGNPLPDGSYLHH
jgi:hypothetical protein